MKEYRKEIIICLLALTIAGCAIWFFTRSRQQENEAGRIDLYDVVAQDASSFLQINRPVLFNRLIQEQSFLDSSLRNIPPVFYALLQEQSSSPSLFSFHPHGSVLYTRVSNGDKKKIEKRLNRFFPYYSPQAYEKYGLRFMYYPDVQNRFLGCFYAQGIWVASYSRSLLEETARNLVTGKSGFPTEALPALRSTDSHSFANILLNSNLLPFHFRENEDQEWSLKDYWIGTDLFISEGNICLFTSFPYADIPEMWSDTLAFTFTEEIKHYLPGGLINYQLQSEEDSYFYTVCCNIE